MKTKHFILPALIFLFILAGCQKDVVFKSFYAFKNNVWNYKDTAVFTVDVGSEKIPANQSYDIYFNIRHHNLYRFKNLWLFVEIDGPGVKEIDTVNIELADEDGFWKGEGLGDIWDYEYLFRNNVKFKAPGKYTFKITHGIRDVDEIMVMELGLIIKKHQENGKK